MGVVLEKISKNYNGRAALKDLDLEVSRGEFHVLLGPNGAGKTTVLSVIAGLTKQDKGTVMVRGRNANGLPPEKRRIGFVFQDYALFSHLSVFDNIAYGLRVRRFKETEIARKVGYYLARVNIEKEKYKYPHQLSGGQKQSVALIRAIVIEPEILLLDEPMSDLDAPAREKTGHELKNFQQEMGITTICVTHDQDEAFSLGDRVSVLNKGKIEQIEAPHDLFYHPKTEFVARFVGAKNILKARIIKIQQHEAIVYINNECLVQPFKITVKRYPIFEKGKEISLCIHPEKIVLKKINEVVGNNLNRIRGKIVNRRSNGKTLKATIDIGGTEIHAAIPKALFDFKIHENVWVCFAPDAPHPLCGKRCRAAEASRRCLNESGSARL